MQQDYSYFNPGMNMNTMGQMAMNPMGLPMNPMQQQMMNAMGGMNPYAAYGGAAYYGNPFGYPVGQTLPTQRTVEKMRKSKQKFTSDGVSSRRFEDVSNSTDESIHLVRSRKIGGESKNFTQRLFCRWNFLKT
jgi:hypothetical protein